MNNLRFSTAVHILVLLDKFRGEIITSDFIARSININPVVVRREIKALKEAGLINSKKGKEGGCMLAMKSELILMGDLYKLVNKESIIGRKNEPNPACPVGKQMNGRLDILFDNVESTLIASLNGLTLKSFSDRFD